MGLLNQPLPTEKKKRALQLSWLNTVLLKFLASQGGSVNQIKPEFLMDWEDFCQIRQTENLPSLSREIYELISQHSWTDFLLQA